MDCVGMYESAREDDRPLLSASITTLIKHDALLAGLSLKNNQTPSLTNPRLTTTAGVISHFLHYFRTIRSFVSKVVAESAVGLTSHTQSSMAPSSPHAHASQAPQNRRTSPCVEQMPSPSKTEREQPPSTRVRGKNKAEDSDFRHENASTSMPAREGNVTRQVDDCAPPTRLNAKGCRQERRKRLAEMEVSKNSEPSSTKRKKPKTTHLNSDLIDDLQTVIGSTCSAMNEYIIRPVDAEEMEVVTRNCTQLFMESHGVRFIVRVTNWLRADPIDAVVWNALEGKELKEALVRTLR